MLNQDKILLNNSFLGPIKFCSDSIATSNNCDFLKDPKFKNAYSLAEQTSPWKGFEMQWRTYIVCSLADYAKNLPGDFVECGVNTGAYSRAIIDFIDFQKTEKTFYLLDTFEGLVPEQITKSEKEAGIVDYLNTYKNVHDEVIKTFSHFRTKIIKGIVPQTLKDCDCEQIAYLSIDMNVVEPEIAALNYFWDKVVPGGVIVLDDYGFPAHINQKHAFDNFAKQKNISLIYIPTGQAIIIK